MEDALLVRYRHRNHVVEKIQIFLKTINKKFVSNHEYQQVLDFKSS